MDAVLLLKWAGVICIIGGSTSLGFQYASEKKKRLEELKYGRKVLLLFRGEIQYHHALLGEAFLALGGRVREPYASFLLQLGNGIREKTGQPFLDIYDAAVTEKLAGQTALSAEHLDKMRMFAEHLGYLDRQAQLAQTDLFLDQIAESIRQEEESYRKNSHLYRCLGVMGGLIISLILI